MHSNTLSRLLASRLMTALGKISFGLYLVHCLVLDTFSCGLYLRLNQFALSYHVQAIITMLLSISPILFCGWLFTKYIEIPSNQLVKKLIK